MNRFPQKRALDNEGWFPLEPSPDLPPNPPESPSVSQLRRLASAFRKSPTSAERWLWELLRGKQLTYRFRRQYVVAGYIVDFYCPKLKLAVEIDGRFHHSRAGKFRANVRDEVLLSYGIKQVVHFEDSLPPSEMFRRLEDLLRDSSTAGKPDRIHFVPQHFPPRGEYLRERDPRLDEILAEGNPKLADLLREISGRKRMA